MKTNQIRLLTVFLAALCAMAAPVRADTIEYTVTDLGTLSGAISFATGINNSGEVIGYGDLATHYSHAFVYTGSGPLVNLGSFGGDKSVSIAHGINDGGTVVGQSDTQTDTRAFAYSGGTMRDLGTLGGAQSIAYGINNLDQIVGLSQLSGSSTYSGFLYSGSGPMVSLGTFYPQAINDNGQIAGSSLTSSHAELMMPNGTIEDLGTLGGPFSFSNAMNNLGEVAGVADLTGGTASHAFLYTGSGSLLDLGTFGGIRSGASSINNAGVVVGSADLLGDETPDAFIYDGAGPIQDLNSLIDPSTPFTIDDAEGINDLGQIAATGVNSNGYYHALLLTPITTPEPSALILVLVAMIFASCWLAKKSCGRMKAYDA